MKWRAALKKGTSNANHPLINRKEHLKNEMGVEYLSNLPRVGVRTDT